MRRTCPSGKSSSTHKLVSLTSNGGSITTDQSSFVVGAASTNGQLAAERDATGPIRIYTLTYVAGDVAGNTSLAS
jgi:hypothetical protein